MSSVASGPSSLHFAHIRAEFNVVTPMFLGGAEHKAERIRGTAIKGALAFWWRAFHFAHHVQRAGENLESALNEMRDREKDLFGSSDGGQGRFLLRVRHGTLDTLKGSSGDEIGAEPGKVLKNGEQVVGVGARYLGYGVVNAFNTKGKPDKNKRSKKEGELERDCITPGQRFTVELLFRPRSSDEDRQEIATALKLFGLLGGLGARVRRGWGSVALIKLEGAGQEWNPPASREEYTRTLKALFKNHPGRNLSGADWPLTAFAQESGVWVADRAGSNALDMLDKIGRAMLNYRGMGRGQDTQVGGQPILKQFQEDHDWFRTGANGVDIPYRSAFGLPHMYDSRNGIGVTAEASDRRASPMMLHVHVAGGVSFGVVSVLPTQFLDGRVTAARAMGPNVTRAYDLREAYGARNASGLDVLLDFLGAEPGKFQPNEVARFDKVLP